MVYTSVSFFILVAVCLLIYYVIPAKYRWIVLLLGSVIFYVLAADGEIREILLFGATILFSYIGGLVLQKYPKGIWLVLFLIGSIAPLLLVKGSVFLGFAFTISPKSLIVPLGLSFYSLQIYSYLFDVYKGHTNAQNNLLRYALFISFFPQIVQGPIPRYKELGEELYQGHPFCTKQIVRGAQLVLWGFFLKYLIAERAEVFVETVFEHPQMYQGMFVLIAGVLYSIQLYADFLSCVCMSRGVAEMFGITLGENFDRPYFAVSVKDFWRRWHISLSSWLRDYVYIPLGGSRKGRVRKYINLLFTFLISGAWHGNGYRFVIWGLMHAVYQILGDALAPVNKRIKAILCIREDSFADRLISMVVTFFLVMIAWIIFRAESMTNGIRMILSIFTVYNPWILFDDSLLLLGLDWKNWMILLAAILTLFQVERLQEMGSVRDRILRQPLVLRWSLYLAVLAIVILFGYYGYGFDAADFIYEGF